MKTCGECAWYEYEKDEPDYGDCMCPLPMSASSDDGYDVDFNSDATCCPCFKARVCGVCGNCGWIPENVFLFCVLR